MLKNSKLDIEFDFLEQKSTSNKTSEFDAKLNLFGFIMCYYFLLRILGSTHTLHTPLDLVKCRLQVDQAKYKNLITGFKVTFKEDGARGLAKGWAPTALGYSAQGLFKYGLYEYFKCLYTDFLGDEAAFLYRTSLYLAASASAEFFADIALSPMEAAKVKVFIFLSITSKTNYQYLI